MKKYALAIAVSLIIAASAYAAQDCTQITNHDDVMACMRANLREAGGTLSETIARLRDEAKAADANKAEDESKLGDKLSFANARYNDYLSAMCDYLSSRITDDKKAEISYARCNQKMIEQRLDLINTETAQ